MSHGKCVKLKVGRSAINDTKTKARSLASTTLRTTHTSFNIQNFFCVPSYQSRHVFPQGALVGRHYLTNPHPLSPSFLFNPAPYPHLSPSMPQGGGGGLGWGFHLTDIFKYRILYANFKCLFFIPKANLPVFSTFRCEICILGGGGGIGGRFEKNNFLQSLYSKKK